VLALAPYRSMDKTYLHCKVNFMSSTIFLNP
jgi:hypothetical protein